MILFNETILAFNKRCLNLLKDIVKDCGLPVSRTRFRYGNYFYPLNVVSFEGKEIGRFNRDYMQIEMNRSLIHQTDKSLLIDILKHEFAHYMTHIIYGDVRPHGAEFHKVCDDLGFPREIAAATVDLGKSFAELDNEEKRLIERVQKLLKLSESENIYEAELATLKANQILLKHNIQHISSSDEETVYLVRLLPNKRKNAKLIAIYDILRHFMVHPVLSTGINTCCIEILGNKANVDLATYVAEFLDFEMERLWKKASRDNQLRGLRAKNSFFRGIAKGYEQKMKSLLKQFSDEEAKGLVVVEQQLKLWSQKVYGRLSQSGSAHRSDFHAEALGHQLGQNLNVRHGVHGSSSSGRYLSGGKNA